MKKQQHFQKKGQFLFLIYLFVALSSFLDLEVGKANSLDQSKSAQERELYSTMPGDNSNNTILDVTNPMDLMNKLRRATAMDNATVPSDAIDQALEAFESEEDNSVDLEGIE